jgi:RNA polymerase sigma factor (sigma-70 family)
LNSEETVADPRGARPEALEQFAAGDPSEACFEAVLPELARLVRGYLTWCGVRGEEIEDLAQEATVRIYTARHRRRGRGIPSLRAWIRTICRNLAVSARSRREAPRNPEPIDFPVARLDLREALDLGIERLREPDRTVFRMRYELEWTTREIADLHGWKMRNCEYVLARARDALARWLTREGFGGLEAGES